MPDRILRKPDVIYLTQVTGRTIGEWEREGKFPRRFRISPEGRAVGWLESEVLEWLQERAASRDAA